MQTLHILNTVYSRSKNWWTGGPLVQGSTVPPTPAPYVIYPLCRSNSSLSISIPASRIVHQSILSRI